MKSKGNNYSTSLFYYILLLPMLEIIYVSCIVSGKYCGMMATVYLFLTPCLMTSFWLFEIDDGKANAINQYFIY